MAEEPESLRSFQEDLLEFIRERAEKVAPIYDPDDDDPADWEGETNWTPSGYVILIDWSGLDNGGGCMTRLMSPNLGTTMRSGMLFEGLHGEWD